MSKFRTATSRDSLTTMYKDFTNSDVYTELQDRLDDVLETFTDINRNDLLLAIFDKYRLSDINIPSKGINQEYTTDELNEFADDLVSIIRLKAPYYNELIKNYKKEYDYATGNKKIVAREDHYTRSGTTEFEGSNDDKTVHYDLPNKNVNPDTYASNPSEMDTDHGENSNTTTIDHASDGTSDIVTTYANEVLDLKRKYLAQIRNVYEEYADECKECFYLIYYTDYVKEED